MRGGSGKGRADPGANIARRPEKESPPAQLPERGDNPSVDNHFAVVSRPTSHDFFAMFLALRQYS